MSPQVKRWTENESFQIFLRQVHIDIWVGLKYGVPEAEVKAALAELARLIGESVEWGPEPKFKVPGRKFDLESE